MSDIRVHRTTLKRTSPLGNLSYEHMAEIVAARYRHRFGAWENPDLLLVHAGPGWDGTFGVGSLLALMLPYALCFMATGIMMVIAWVAFELPLGPHAGVFYQVAAHAVS